MSADAMFAALRICRFHGKPLLSVINRDKVEGGLVCPWLQFGQNQTKTTRKFCFIDNARKELGGHAETLEQLADINEIYAKNTTNTGSSSLFRLHLLVV